MSATTPVKAYLLGLQDQICEMLLKEEGTEQGFQQDIWHRSEGGGGITRVFEDGQTIEKAGVNFSEIFGAELPASATARKPQLAGQAFQAMGISVVIHPRNPYAPTTHMNLRLLTATIPGSEPVWWFGGGFDLTPYYGYTEDCQHFHKHAQAACETLGPDVYSHYKKWADDYFYLKHRQEPRGIGGIFFDDLNQWDFATCFAFIQKVGQHFILAYQPILQRRKATLYDQQARDFQLYRRGRYVEFNLLYDRGTLFGLQSGGRTESILISLPPQVVWRYQWAPQSDTIEAQLLADFLTPRDWLGVIT